MLGATVSSRTAGACLRKERLDGVCNVDGFMMVGDLMYYLIPGTSFGPALVGGSGRLLHAHNAQVIDGAGALARPGLDSYRDLGLRFRQGGRDRILGAVIFLLASGLEPR